MFGLMFDILRVLVQMIAGCCFCSNEVVALRIADNRVERMANMRGLYLPVRMKRKKDW